MLAQLAEHLTVNQGVTGSSPVHSVRPHANWSYFFWKGAVLLMYPIVVILILIAALIGIKLILNKLKTKNKKKNKKKIVFWNVIFYIILIAVIYSIGTIILGMILNMC